jgi:integral membrane protein (TIGR01906 family)
LQEKKPSIARRERAARWLVHLLSPAVFLLLSLRLVLITAHVWVPLEYRAPGFPDDPYGFTLQERIYWSSVDIEFLLNDADISYFDSYRLEDSSPMHNERELRHMVDVKRLIGYTVWALWAGLALLGLLTAALWKFSGRGSAMEALAHGSRNTFYFMGVLLIGIVFSFGVVFVGFHRIFFEAGTWRFRYSDTFIRLYPERFWRDTFLLLLFTTAVLAVVVRQAARRLGWR